MAIGQKAESTARNGLWLRGTRFKGDTRCPRRTAVQRGRPGSQAAGEAGGRRGAAGGKRALQTGFA